MQPIGMSRGFLGLIPFGEHQRRNAFQLGMLIRGADIACQFQPVAIGIEEIDRTKNAVKRRPDYGNALCLDMRFGGKQRFQIGNLERDMLHPFRGVEVPRHVRLIGKLEKGDDIAAASIQKHMHIRIIFARRRYMILRKRRQIFHAEHIVVKLDRLFRIPTAIGNMMDFRERERSIHQAGSTSSTPRSIWSRSIDSNSALKLPSPNPSSPRR